MSDIPEDIRCVARDIMDSACLGEHWANNGVDAALREAIARAILAERDRCIGVITDLYRRQLTLPVQQGNYRAGYMTAIGESLAHIRGDIEPKKETL